MATIRFMRRSSVEFGRPSTQTPDIERGFYFEGSDTEPQLYEVFLPPNYVSQSHAHSQDEIVFVIDGELDFGSGKMMPGDAVSVPANTLFGFRVGTEGARFLNYRTRRGRTFRPRRRPSNAVAWSQAATPGNFRSRPQAPPTFSHPWPSGPVRADQ